MRHVRLSSLAGLALALSMAPALAQTSPPPAAAPSSADPGIPPPASPYPPAVAATTPTQPVPKVAVPADEQLDAKYVHQTCLDYAQSQGLKSEAMDTAVSACMSKVRPDLGGKP